MFKRNLKIGAYAKLLIAMIFAGLSYVAFAEDRRLVVVTHPDNQEVITREDLYRLYFGKRTTLPSGTRIIPVLNDGDEELLTYFSSEMLQRSPQQLRSYWARQLFTGKGKPPVHVDNSVELKDLVAGNPKFVGFLWESELDSSVRVVLTAN